MWRLLWLALWLGPLRPLCALPEPILRCPPRADASQCHFKGHQTDEYSFTINGSALTITYGVTYFQLKCPVGVTLDDGVLPGFRRSTVVPRVTLQDCAPPSAGFGGALATLNVSLATNGTLRLISLPPSGTFAREHLRGLRVASLTLSASSLVRVAPDFLRDSNVTELYLTKINISANRLDLLPPTIRRLSIMRSELESLPAAALRRLSRLERLKVESGRLRSARLDEAPSLRTAEIVAPLLEVALGAALENFSLNVWPPTAGRGPVAPSGECGVRRLLLLNVPEEALAAWFERCGALQSVLYRCARGGGAGRLPLAGAGAATLRELRVHNCRLREGNVAADWLAAAANLATLDLSLNTIEALPRGLLVPSEALREVSLRRSNATRDALQWLAACTSLRELDLSDNPVGDLCATSGDRTINAVSPVARLRWLRTLRLADSGATRLCADWRRDLPALVRLDLQRNNITELLWDDLQWTRSQLTEVDLRGNPLRDLRYGPADYRSALRAPAIVAPVTTLHIDSELNCDCAAYWYARAVRERPEHRLAVVDALLCQGGVPLSEMPLDTLTCAVPSPPCPSGCVCATHGAGATMRCAGAGLERVPAPPPELQPLRSIDLAHNNITHVEAALVPREVTMLNLSNNLIERIEASEVYALLGEATRRVSLGGNRLRCACAEREGLAAMRLHSARLVDWPLLRCADGRALAGLQLADLCQPESPLGGATGLLVASLAAAALALALLAFFLLNPRARKHVKRFLSALGLAVAWPGTGVEDAATTDEDDAQCEYDAFVSFSHVNATRAHALVARLEARGRRLCVHHRDWLPGELITTQIVTSVRRSRRTVVLLSDAFLASTWARAEFRSAWAHAQASRSPRLLLVLLPELSIPRDKLSATLDAELAAFVASNTYLEWEDLRFWQKLESAIPSSSRAAAAPPPANQRY